MKFPLIVSFIFCLGFSLAQVDQVSYDASSKTLNYLISYDRNLATAEALECDQETFESGLLHSALHHIFLFLPFEASYYPDVEQLAVRVNRSSEETLSPVLIIQAPLEEIKATNSVFRVFMNSFSSIKAGFCFAADAETLNIWLTTLKARGGKIALDTEVFVTEIEASNLDELLAEQTPEETAQASETPDVAPDGLANLGLENYQISSYLSDTQVLQFNEASLVLENNTDYVALIETTAGSMLIDLFEDLSPVTVNNFIFLARNHFYEGITFHRVIDDFMAQSGDPTGSGSGGPGYQFADEFVEGLSHSTAGVVSMANAGPDSNGSQFFITLSPTPWLDGKHSIFGAVTQGLDTLDTLKRTNPAEPLAVAALDSSLGILKTQGINLSGNDETVLSDYLNSFLEAKPEPGQRFSFDTYEAAFGVNPQTGQEVLGFWPQGDRIIEVKILEKPKE